MPLYHTTHQDNADSIIANGFQPLMEGDVGAGVWCCEAPYWDDDVFAAEGPQTEFGFFQIDIPTDVAQEFFSQNPDTGGDEWFLPIQVANDHFTTREYHRFDSD